MKILPFKRETKRGVYKKQSPEAKLKEKKLETQNMLYDLFVKDLKSHPDFATELARSMFGSDIDRGGYRDDDDDRFPNNYGGGGMTDAHEMISSYREIREMMKEEFEGQNWKMLLAEKGLPLLEKLGGAMAVNSMMQPQHQIPQAQQQQQLSGGMGEENPIVTVIQQILTSTPTEAGAQLLAFRNHPDDLRGMLFNLLANNSMEELVEKLESFKENPMLEPLVSEFLRPARKKWLAYVADEVKNVVREGESNQLSYIPVNFDEAPNREEPENLEDV